jgi:hypothetical protein
MRGLFDRKRPDAAAVRRVKTQVTERLGLPGTATLTVAELACHEPGCPPIETVVTVQDADGQRRTWRLHKPVAEITAADVEAAISGAPAGTG